jgi:hypothetical protein
MAALLLCADFTRKRSIADACKASFDKKRNSALPVKVGLGCSLLAQQTCERRQLLANLAIGGFPRCELADFTKAVCFAVDGFAAYAERCQITTTHQEGMRILMGILDDKVQDLADAVTDLGAAVDRP